MNTPFRMSEESMQHMEAQIPELAGSAVKRTYWQALTTTGKVLEARNGQLVETTADGSVRVMRSIAKPVSVTLGAKRTRAPKAARIWLNLELAKKPEACLEYIVVHELLHLLERHHNAHFTGLMDQHVPHWRQSRQLLTWPSWAVRR